MSLIFCLGFGPQPFPLTAAREPFFISKIMSVAVSIYMSIYLSSLIYLSTYLSTYLSIYLSFLIYLQDLSVYLCIY